MTLIGRALFVFYVCLAMNLFLFHTKAIASGSPLITQGPTAGSFSSCQNEGDITSAKNDCESGAKQVAEGCKDMEQPQGPSSVPRSGTVAGQTSMESDQASALAAQQFRALCVPAEQACKSKCEKYKNAANSCSPKSPIEQHQGPAAGQKSAGTSDADKVLNSTCKSAENRNREAGDQKGGNEGNKDQNKKDNVDNNKEGGGAPPPLPQAPPGGGGGSGGTPTAADPATANPCLNSRCDAQPATVSSFAPPSKNDTSSTKAALNSSKSDLLNSSLNGSGSGGGGSAGTGGSGGGGSFNPGAPQKPETPPAAAAAKKAYSMPESGGSYDGGGGGSGYSGSSSSSSESNPYGVRGLASAKMAGLVTSVKGGPSGAGGRSNWEKVRGRYTESMTTFTKEP